MSGAGQLATSVVWPHAFWLNNPSQRILAGGKIIEHGAKTVSTGGYFTMPRLSVDGAVFIGASAAVHNSPALKGIHGGMKSGMLAAEAIVEALEKDDVTAAGLGK